MWAGMGYSLGCLSLREVLLLLQLLVQLPLGRILQYQEHPLLHWRPSKISVDSQSAAVLPSCMMQNGEHATITAYNRNQPLASAAPCLSAALGMP